MYSMGTDVADINNDGFEDIYVSEMLPADYQRSKVSMPSMDVEGFYNIVNAGMHKQYMHNALHLNQGNLFFSEISQLSGVAKTEWSWSCLLSDFNNDGNRDIFVANGYKRDVFDGDAQQKLQEYVQANKHKYNSPQEMLEKGFKDFINVYQPIKVKNYLFKNTGDLKFENASDTWGFNETSFSNGAAVADLDNDGDLELVVNNLDEEAFIYENTSSATNNYLNLKLNGPKGNSNGIGAKVTIYYQGNLQYFENKTVRGYLSSNDPVVHFGLGKEPKVDSIKIVWNDGKVNLIKETKANQLIQVEYAKAGKAAPGKSAKPLIFQEASSIIANEFTHKENNFYEYKDQVLLPHMFSRSGPFMTVGDVNNDGAEDFYVGGASNQAGSLYVQSDGNLVKKSVPAFETDKGFEDMGSLLFDVDQDGDMDLYVVSGGSEFAEGAQQYQDRLYLNDGKGNFTKSILPTIKSSGSCVVPYDIDGDGDLDLFRGGQVVASAYPKSPKSYLLINEKGKFVDKTDELAPGLSNTGMVNSAIWVDLNGDKKSELVVVGEWMPIKVYEIKEGKLANVSDEQGLQDTEGWWNKIITNDLDGDGDQDLILGNLGENYKFSASVEKPFEVYAKDFDGNGTNDIFLARHYSESLLLPIRGKECTSQQMPIIAQKFPTYRSYAESDLNGILGTNMENAMHRKAVLFSSVILINENGKFTIKRLPTEAQLSTINGIIVYDFDKDGKKDILVAGNKFDVEVETTAADASPGAFMKGTGALDFKPVKHFESGFSVPFNVKDIQMITLQGKPVILVTSNNDKLRVFESQ
jgi:enediyne biosynthesis protein E4